MLLSSEICLSSGNMLPFSTRWGHGHLQTDQTRQEVLKLGPIPLMKQSVLIATNMTLPSRQQYGDPDEE